MISIVQLGTLAYAEGLRLQQKLVELRKNGQIGDVLLLLEHTPVITLGRNAKAANVLMPAEQLAARGVEVFDCDRGGDVTFHGPGQVVGYPILDLRGFSRQPSAAGGQPLAVGRNPSAVTREPSAASSLSGPGEPSHPHLPDPSPRHPERSRPIREADRPAESKAPYSTRNSDSLASLPIDRKTLGAVDYVRRLEEVLIRTCADFGIATKRVPGLTGVWTDPSSSSCRAEENDSENRSLESRDLVLPALHSEAKIAAIGVHISRSVTSHGFALNVNTDLSFFDLIVPCGITSKPVASMQKELGREVSLAAVAESLSHNFASVFARQILWAESLDALLGQAVGVPMKRPKELRQIHGDNDQVLA